MTIKGQIIDANSGEVLPGATVAIVDARGNYLGQGVAADASGVFSFTSPLIDNNFVLLTYAGYHSLLYEPALLQKYSTIEMYDVEDDLTAVEVVRKKPKSYVAVAVLSTTAALGTMAGNENMKIKGRRISGASVGQLGFKVTDAILPVGMLLLVFAIAKPIMQKLGLWDSEQDKKAREEQEEREEKEEESQKQICEITPSTKTDAEWKQIADTLENDFDYAGYLGAYRDNAVYQLARAKNDCDVQKIISFFGTRQLRNLLLIKDVYYTLNQAVLERLNQDDVNIVNNNYANKGIKYRW